MLCQNNVRYTQLYCQQRYHNILHRTTRKQELLCEHVCLWERERQGECFLADLITIQPLSNPALPLSTYNMAAYPLERLEESAVEERAIRVQVIENTQETLTQRAQLPRKGAMCVWACVRVWERERERACLCVPKCLWMCMCVPVQYTEGESPDEQRFELRKRQTHSAWHLTKYFHCFSCWKQVSSNAAGSAKRQCSETCLINLIPHVFTAKEYSLQQVNVYF